MSTEHSVAALVEFIEQRCLQSQEVLGTDLGAAIRVDFPEINLKTEFGGLRKFIQTYCSGKVYYVRPRGGDGVYAHVSRLDAPPSPRGPRTSSAWAALVDPKVPARLAVDSASGVLRVYAATDPAPEALLPVEKLSLEEHRAIAEEFLPKLPESARQPFEAALKEQEAFWPKWTAAFQRLADRSVYIEWMKWRHDRIILLFEERLRTGQLSAKAVSTAVSELRESKQDKGPLNASAVPPIGPVMPATLRTAFHAPDAQLRALARSALDLMSEDEIRRIWLPLGAMADACRKKP